MTLLLLATLSLAGQDAKVLPQADAPGTVNPTRWWDVQHLHLDLRIDIDQRTVSGTATHRIAPLPSSHDTLRLHQVGLDVSQVRVDGEVVDGWRLGTDVLDVPVSGGQSHVVAIDYSARPETGLHFRGFAGSGDAIPEVWSQGEDIDNRHWYPGWDHPSDRFTVDIDLTVRDGLIALANGTLQTRQAAEPGWTRWSYTLPQPVVNYLVAIAVGDYAVHTVPDSRIPLEIVAPRRVPAAVATQGFDQIGPMLPYFDELLGTPLPYPNMRQVVVQRFLYGGMENTTLIMMADGLLVDAPYKDPRRTESVTAHELAHQWFGDLLTCYGWRELWLNEGFATHYTNRWMDHRYGPAYAAVRRRGSYDGGLHASTPMAARSWSRQGDQANTAVYTRGSTVLHMLEVHLGRQVFDEGIRRYVAANQDRLVESEDLRRALEDVSGEHLGWLFDQWVFRGGAPHFTVKHRYAPPGGGQPGQITVTVEQTGDGPAWFAPVEVEIGTADGVLVRRIWAGEGSTTLVVDHDTAPSWVLADPRRGVLAHWKQEQEPAQWVQAAQRSPTWDGRLQAIDALGQGKATPEVIRTLATVLADADLDPAVRAQASSALGALGTPEARDALLNGLKETSWPWPLRERVAADLGSFEGDAVAARSLQRTVERERHAGVLAEALSALAAVDEQAALPLARQGLAGRLGGGAPPVVSASARVIGTAGTRSDATRLLPLLQASQHTSVRHAAARGLAAHNKAHPDEAFAARSARALEPLLEDVDLRTQGVALRALGTVGDEITLQRLQAHARTSTLPHAAEEVAGTSSAIRRRLRGDAPSEPAPDDLDALRERLEKAEARIEELGRWK